MIDIPHTDFLMLYIHYIHSYVIHVHIIYWAKYLHTVIAVLVCNHPTIYNLNVACIN